MNRCQVSEERLKELLTYKEGVFFWNLSRGGAAKGSVAGSLNSEGYLLVWIDKINYKCHRLAWLYTYGCWPDNIDHINGNRSDNRIENIRSVSAHENTKNQKIRSDNTSGFTGVSYYKGRWITLKDR